MSLAGFIGAAHVFAFFFFFTWGKRIDLDGV